MNVLKSFELRQAGNKLVLRQMCPPDYEMRTLFVADRIVEEKEDFFVLGYNGKFYCLCRYDEQNGCLCLKKGCDDYVWLGGKVLLLQGAKWHLWDDNFQVHFLGEAVNQEKTMFARKFYEDKIWNGLICSVILRKAGCVRLSV